MLTGPFADARPFPSFTRPGYNAAISNHFGD